MSNHRTLSTYGIVFLTAMLIGCASYKSYGQSAFANGADVGWLTQLESLGYTYVDQSQVQTSALQILKNHGVNAIRIRTFVNPTITSGSLGVGNNNQAGSIALAQTANSMGFKIMIDFQYSDTWADPGHQTIPAAWSSYTFPQMENAVWNYTYNFMKALAADGIYPQWVQVGNEIDNGMLWPIGSTSNPQQLAWLINSGYNAVKAVSSSTQVIVHLSTISDLSHFETFFDTLKAQGGSFDVIGGSYYDGPGTLSAVTSNLNTLASRYGKPVMICEIGHSVGDWFGSADDVKSAIEAVKAVPNNRGLGVFYWEAEAPNDSTTSNYTMGAVSEASGKVLEFTPTIDQYLFTGAYGNQIIDPNFASGLNGWQISTNGNENAVYTQPSGSGYELSFWKSSAYQATVWQDVTALPNGTYTMTAWVQNGGGQTSATMFAYPTGGSETSVNLPVASGWTEVQIPNVQITQGKVFLGLSVNANAGNWTNVNYVGFTKN